MISTTSQLATVVRTDHADRVFFTLELELPVAMDARPGMFVQIAIPLEPDRFSLPRPISIASMNGRYLRLLIREAGRETGRMKQLAEGDLLRVFGPLGNGFSKIDEPVLAVGGGFGLAPLLNYLEEAPADSLLLAGYRSGDDHTHLVKLFPALGKAIIATEDGTIGTHGRVTELLTEKLLSQKWGAIFICGPEAMMNACVARVAPLGHPIYVSLETYMGCGYGVCVGCAVPTADGNMLLACKDGPVFPARLLKQYQPFFVGDGS